MPALNLALDYFDHPKVNHLVDLLGHGSDLLPLRLWCYCGKFFSEDGRLTGHSAERIERVIRWWGPKGACVKGLIEAGFLEKHEDVYVVHDWKDHAGHFSKYREKAQKAAQARWGKPNSDKNMLVASNKQCLEHATSNAPAGQCNAGQKDAVFVPESEPAAPVFAFADDPLPDNLTTEGLTFNWVSSRRRTRRRGESEAEIAEYFRDLIGQGFKPRAIYDAIRSRSKVEPIWDFVQSFTKTTKPVKESPKDQLQKAREQEARQKAEIDAKKGIKP